MWGFIDDWQNIVMLVFRGWKNHYYQFIFGHDFLVCFKFIIFCCCQFLQQLLVTRKYFLSFANFRRQSNLNVSNVVAISNVLLPILNEPTTMHCSGNVELCRKGSILWICRCRHLQKLQFTFKNYADLLAILHRQLSVTVHHTKE